MDMYYRTKGRAKKHGIPFNLDVEDIVIPDKCPILGIELNKSKFTGRPLPNTPSIDKIIPAKGYVKGNIDIISYRANSLKNNGTLEEFKKIVEYLERHTLTQTIPAK